jgi:hypothetical protein
VWGVSVAVVEPLPTFDLASLWAGRDFL